ncbi:carbohydrate esterase family 8 [Pyrenophora seminiperda CCB06]|uniref:pectinesterase n=1 Tax=Pyrenophora seminiperda CCB06 TaxID=1302712 RepID=A0A3M7MG61_9PLEO|nr:carbohydrate esterase family 8 [Pyrenophora seminiperda CCB06]
MHKPVSKFPSRVVPLQNPDRHTLSTPCRHYGKAACLVHFPHKFHMAWPLPHDSRYLGVAGNFRHALVLGIVGSDSPSIINRVQGRMTKSVHHNMLYSLTLVLPLVASVLAAPGALVSRAGRPSAPSGCLSVGANSTYKTVQAAVDALSSSGTAAQCIFIASGTYKEQVYIRPLQSALNIYGQTSDTSTYGFNTVTITQGKSQDDSANNDLTATLRAWTPNLRVYNLNIVNSRGKGSQALAVSAYADKQGYYGCQFKGYQDTILAQTGKQLYAKSYIEGSTDFIFGQQAAAWFEGVTIGVLPASVGYITANGRDSASNPSFYVINNSKIQAASGTTVAAGTYYLGRPWRNFSRVVFQKTSMTNAINSLGWTTWQPSDPRTDSVTYQEFANTGDGSKGTRASFSKKISAAIPITTILGSDYASWVDQTYLSSSERSGVRLYFLGQIYLQNMSYGTIENPPAEDRDNTGLVPPHPPVAAPKAQHAPSPQRSRFLAGLKNFYDRNFGLFLVFLAQTCGSIMNTTAKLLTDDPSIKFHALQIIFIRMLCTSIMCSIYCWCKRVPDFPLGQKGIRGLLILRGTAGFVGLFGLYYSLSWLEISDATVITFLIPTMTALVCFLWLREPFTWKEALCSFIAFLGVLFVARPPWLLPHKHPVAPPTTPNHPDNKTPLLSPQQRTLAVLMAILGTFGASMAYATIRVIGKRAHSLISVNYFSLIATLASFFIILLHPDLRFVAPKSLGQWGLIAVIGLFGFLLQFLLTEGLQREKGGRATNLMYLQLVFALGVERVIWGTTPPLESWIGALLIIGAAVAVSLQKETKQEKVAGRGDEERGLLGDEE